MCTGHDRLGNLGISRRGDEPVHRGSQTTRKVWSDWTACPKLTGWHASQCHKVNLQISDQVEQSEHRVRCRLALWKPYTSPSVVNAWWNSEGNQSSRKCSKRCKMGLLRNTEVDIRALNQGDSNRDKVWGKQEIDRGTGSTHSQYGRAKDCNRSDPIFGPAGRGWDVI